MNRNIEKALFYHACYLESQIYTSEMNDSEEALNETDSIIFKHLAQELDSIRAYIFARKRDENQTLKISDYHKPISDEIRIFLKDFNFTFPPKESTLDKFRFFCQKINNENSV